MAATVIEVVYYARFMKIVFGGDRHYIKPESNVYIPMMIFAVVIVVFGIYPHPVFTVLSSVSSFLAGGI